MVFRTLITIIFVGIILHPPTTEAQSTVPGADHHLHIRSEAGTGAFLKILKKVRQQEGVDISDSTTAGKVIELLDAAGTHKAALLSTAYFFGMPEVDFENEYSKVRAENDYVARQAALYPERLTAFCGLNPLKDYAVKEVERCSEKSGVIGIKLHFANSSVDLRNENHRRKAAEVFRAANRNGMAVVVHLWTRNPDYGRKDVKLFIDEILAEAPDITVQVAHLGGPGTYSNVTHRASTGFIEAIDSEHPLMDDIYFDLSSVPTHPERAESEDDRQTRVKLNRQLAKRIRELGPGRILWGTDWIAGPTERYVKRVQSIPLPEKILAEISANTAPYLQE